MGDNNENMCVNGGNPDCCFCRVAGSTNGTCANSSEDDGDACVAAGNEYVCNFQSISPKCSDDLNQMSLDNCMKAGDIDSIACCYCANDDNEDNTCEVRSTNSHEDCEGVYTCSNGPVDDSNDDGFFVPTPDSTGSPSECDSYISCLS